MMFSKTTPAVLATIFIGITAGASALACSTDGWDAVSGAVVVGSPFGATPPDENGISRFEELCALRANGTGHVQTNTPSHGRVRIRLYAWPDLTATRGVAGGAKILAAYSAENGTGELFSIQFDDGLWWIVADPNGGGQASAPATGGWDELEVDWDPATSMVHMWVNTDATTDPATVSTASGPAGTVEAVRVGLISGLGSHTGQVYADSVEMRNETAIGPLPNCDADGSTSIDVNDAVAVVDEIFNVALADGTPDCDYSGGPLDVNDAVAIVDEIFGGG